MTSSSPTPERIAADLADLLHKQSRLYEGVCTLAEQQNESITKKDTAMLMDILGRKQKLMEGIEALAPSTEQLREAWEAARDAAPQSARDTVEAAVEALRAILARIVELENEGQATLDASRKKTGDAIVRLQKGKAMHKAYGAAAKKSPTPRFQDRNG